MTKKQQAELDRALLELIELRVAQSPEFFAALMDKLGIM